MAEHRWELTTRDSESGEECYVSLRRIGDSVLIGLSLREDGDIEVALSMQDAQELGEQLKAMTGGS